MRFSLRVEIERADAEWDCRTCLARPSCLLRRERVQENVNKKFPVQLITSRIGNLTRCRSTRYFQHAHFVLYGNTEKNNVFVSWRTGVFSEPLRRRIRSPDSSNAQMKRRKRLVPSLTRSGTVKAFSRIFSRIRIDYGKTALFARIDPR